MQNEKSTEQQKQTNASGSQQNAGNSGQSQNQENKQGMPENRDRTQSFQDDDYKDHTIGRDPQSGLREEEQTHMAQQGPEGGKNDWDNKAPIKPGSPNTEKGSKEQQNDNR